MPGWCPQRRDTACTLPNFLCCSMYFFCVVLCDVCFVTFSVLFVCICVLNKCHRVATQLQLNIFYHIYDAVCMHYGPCEEDWEFYGGRHSMSKRTWDIGVAKVIKRERKQAIALALGGKSRKDRSGRFLEVLYSKPLGVSVETRQCILHLNFSTTCM
jgi:hypothetical protein